MPTSTIIANKAASGVAVQGLAPRFANLLHRGVITGLLRVSCRADVVDLLVPEADFSIRISRDPASGLVRLAFRAVFRAPGDHGGTWWTDWSVPTSWQIDDAAMVTQVITAQVQSSRDRYARMLAQRSPDPAEPRRPGATTCRPRA